MNWSKKELLWLALVLVVGFGFFLRSYHFSDWLHFELDQARDAKVIDAALEGGAADLPLLGPRAGGTFLRLAPGFYWLEYLGALITGDAVVGAAAMVLFFSILSLPLFYLFVRRFFSLPIALGLLGLFATSAFMVMYGRFAWNPNLVPFFSLLGFYGLLRSVDRDEAHQGRWLLVSAFGLGLATHMHFLAFLALPAIAGGFLILKRPQIALKFWFGAMFLVVLLYVPMVLNEIATGGANAREFVAALTEKSSKEDHSLLEKAIRDVSEFSLHSVVILSGFEGATLPSVIASNGVLGSVCRDKCDEGKWYGMLAVLLLGVAFILLAKSWYLEQNLRKKDFLLLLLLWFGVTFVLFLPLSYGIAPRFFLLNTPLFFALLGLLLKGWQTVLSKRVSVKAGQWGALFVITLLIWSNLWSLSVRFGQLREAGVAPVENMPDRILKEPMRVTLEQQQSIVDFLAERSRVTGWPIYMKSESRYERALKYHLERRSLRGDALSITTIYREGIYFLILRTTSNHTATLEKYKPYYDIGSQTSFGTLTAIELFPKTAAITAERQDFSRPEKEANTQVAPRYTIREFFSRTESQGKEDASEEEVE